MGKMNMNRAVRERHKAAKRVEELEGLLANAEARIRAEVQAEVDLLKADIADLNSQVETALDERDGLARVLRQERAERSLQAERHQAALVTASAQLDALRSDRDRWQAEAQAAAPTVAEAVKSVRDLQALVDKVRDRMTRKDREAERAILNRKALTKALLIPEPELATSDAEPEEVVS